MSDGGTTWVRLPVYELTDIGACKFPRRGTTYYFTVSGHNIQVYVTEKLKKVRVFVDHREWKADDE